jgi:hypothetical protein
MSAPLAVWALAAAMSSGPPLFSQTGLAGWKAEHGKRDTRYELVEDAGMQVLHAVCDDSASGESWRGKVDLRVTPILRWRWKIAALYPGLDERVKGGSDFPARVYLIAGHRWLPWSIKVLAYVWSNGAHPDPLPAFPSPYFKQELIVPVRRGAQGVGQWQEESRDVRADFAHYFKAEVDEIGAVVVMTDCDDAHGRGEAWYGDVRFTAR